MWTNILSLIDIGIINDCKAVVNKPNLIAVTNFQYAVDYLIFWSICLYISIVIISLLFVNPQRACARGLQ